MSVDDSRDGKGGEETRHYISESQANRLIPGGDHPARTPGGTGPSTRDTERSVADDANEQLIGRARIAGELKARARPGDK